MTISVLVPWRGGCPHRERAWDYVQQLWAATHPDWQVVQGTCPTDEWIKAHAVADALRRADGDTLVVADADVWADDLDQAVEQLDGHPWAVPHLHVHRLRPEGVDHVLGGGHWIEAPLEHRGTYVGHEGGGITILRRELYERVPLDPRFVGWGQEDDSWALALRTLAGRPWRGHGVLWHLWHPPQPRLERKVGNLEGQRLWLRYREANQAGDPAWMASIVAEHVGQRAR